MPFELPGFVGRSKWVKADMLATVGLNRLSFARENRDAISGRRRFIKMKLSMADVISIRRCVLHALGLSGLTQHLVDDI